MRVDQNGNVGIGTASPGNGARLHVYSSGNAIMGTAGGGVGTIGVFGQAHQLGDFGAAGMSTYTNYYCYIGTSIYSLSCQGPTAGVSDERLKKDIEPLGAAEGLTAIMALEPVHYRWKDDRKNPGGRREIGFTAQNVEKVLPELVGEMEQSKDTKDPNVEGKVKAMSYDRLAAPLVKAVQELKAENDKLREDLNDLREAFEGFKSGPAPRAANDNEPIHALKRAASVRNEGVDF